MQYLILYIHTGDRVDLPPLCVVQQGDQEVLVAVVVGRRVGQGSVQEAVLLRLKSNLM